MRWGSREEVVEGGRAGGNEGVGGEVGVFLGSEVDVGGADIGELAVGVVAAVHQVFFVLRGVGGNRNFIYFRISETANKQICLFQNRVGRIFQ